MCMSVCVCVHVRCYLIPLFLIWIQPESKVKHFTLSSAPKSQSDLSRGSSEGSHIVCRVEDNGHNREVPVTLIFVSNERSL